MTTAEIYVATQAVKKAKKYWPYVLGVLLAPPLLVLAILGSLFSSSGGSITPTTPGRLNTAGLTQFLPLFKAAGNSDGYAALPPSVQSAVTHSGHTPCQLPWQLIAAIASIESNYNPNAGSFLGAQGITQFEPLTFAGYSHTVGLLSPPGGVMPPNPFNAADDIYATSLKLCGDGASSASVWSSGDTQAVGLYNCGSWVQNPSSCITYHLGTPVQTTSQYVGDVMGVFLALMKNSALNTTTTTPTGGTGGSSTSNTPTSTTTTMVSPGDPLIPQIAADAVNLDQLAAPFPDDSKFIHWVFDQACTDAGVVPTVPYPKSASDLSSTSKTPFIGAVAATSSGLGIVIATGAKDTATVAIVLGSHVVTTISTPKGTPYGVVAGE